MATEHYNFTELNNDNNIDIVNDTTTFLNEIDTAIYEAVESVQVKDGSITTAKLADGAVTNAKLADNTVTSNKLSDGSVTTGKIDDEAITTAKITDSAVTNTKLADGAVTANNIQSGSVITEKIATTAVTYEKIANNVFSQIFSGMEVKYFDTADSTIVNNASCPTTDAENRLAGFYIPDMKLLVITQMFIGENTTQYTWYNTSQANYKFPSYVPKPNVATKISTAGMLWSQTVNDTDVVDYTGIGITTYGAIAPNTDHNGHQMALAGNLIINFNTIPHSTTASTYSAYSNENGAL